MANFRVGDSVVTSDGRTGTYKGQGSNSTKAIVWFSEDGSDTAVVNVASLRKQK